MTNESALMGTGQHRRKRLSLALALGVATATAIAGIGPGAVATAATVDDASVVNIVDTTATPETRSLFSSLQSQRGDGILFGQQHVLDNGITFASPGDGVSSDVLAGTGDYPAVFGWDTLILDGRETPGTATNTPAQNLAAFRAGLQQAHRLGGINEISAHLPNFVTGNDFKDASGRVISHILPGGDKNADFTAYLDTVAELANTTTDDSGTLIPMIFRPFHENTGSWFWWGAAWASPGEYKEIFRYTVEYLRDVRGVTNFLYSFSPNGSFGGDAQRYLATYPGDDFVDILGYDSYENSNASETSDSWIATLIPDLAMVSDLADQRGKISALTEFGRNGDRTIQPSGNKSLNYFTDTLAAIKADPKASRISYMLTWANFGGGQMYVPNPAFGDQPEHEMFPDFLEFYNDPFTTFAAELPADLYDRRVDAAPASASVRFVTPADGQSVTGASTTVRTRLVGSQAQRVFFTTQGLTGDGDTQQHELTLGEDGYYSALWQVSEADLSNRTVALTVTAQRTGESDLTGTASVILGTPAVLAPGVIDDFEGYGDDTALRAAYTINNGAADSISLESSQVGSGSKAVRFAYDFAGENGYLGFGKTFSATDWSRFDSLHAWLAPDGSGQKLVFQVKAGGYTFEAYPSLDSTTAAELAIPFADFRAPSWDAANADKRLTPALLASVTEFFAYVNQVGASTSGSIVLDDIRAAGGATQPTDPPAPGPVVVDDFEAYASNSEVQTAWAGRDNEADLSLTGTVAGSGAQAAAFAYDFATVGYAGIAKNITSDWSGNDRLKLWVTPDGSGNQLVVQFRAGGVSFEGYSALTGTTAAQVSIPFADAAPASYQGLDPALRPTAAQLRSVTEVAIFLTAKPGASASAGTVYLDDVRATTADVPDPEPTPVPEPATSRTSVSIASPVMLSWLRTTVSVRVSSDGDAIPTGDVVLKVGTKTFTSTVGTDGSVKFRLPTLRQGLYRVTVTYAGDAVTAPSVSRTKWILVLF